MSVHFIQLLDLTKVDLRQKNCWELAGISFTPTAIAKLRWQKGHLPFHISQVIHFELCILG